MCDMTQRPATPRNKRRVDAADAKPLSERTWLNLNETAEYFSMHRTTVYRHLRNGRFPESAVGRFNNGARRFNRAELERWMTQRDAAA